MELSRGDSTDLERFWIEFDLPPRSADLPEIEFLHEFPDEDASLRHFLSRGVGVTGYDLDDCLHLIDRAIAEIASDHAQASRSTGMAISRPAISRLVERPDVSDLERTIGQVRGVAVIRGIWFPADGPAQSRPRRPD